MAWEMPTKKGRATQAAEVEPTNVGFDFVMPTRPPRPADTKSPELQLLEERSAPERMAIGLGSRLTDIGQGLKQTAGMVRNLLPGEPSTWPQEVAERARAERGIKAAIRKDPMSAAGAIGADIAATLPMASVLRGPILGGAVMGGALTGPGTPREDPSFGQLGEDTLTGMGFGGVGGALTQGLVSGVGRGMNAARGNFKDPATAARYAAFKEWDVPGSLGDIGQVPLIKYGENIAQYAPFSGREAFLGRQATAMKKALDEAPSRIAGTVSAVTKEDTGKTLAKSIKDQYKFNKNMAGVLYDDVERLVKSAGAPPIPPSNLSAAAKALKKEYPKVFDAFQDTTAVSRLNSIIEGTGPQSSKVLGPTGLPIQTPPKLSFDDMRWLDKRLGAMIRQGDKQVLAGKMDPEAFRQMTELQKALRQDVTDWSNQIGMPEIAAGVQNANKFFAEKVVPFRQNRTTRKVIRDELDTDKIGPAMLRLDSPVLADDTLRFLTPEGQQAAKYYLVQQAEKRAMEEAFNPRLGFLRPEGQTALGETGPKFFGPRQLDQLGSLENMVTSGHRAVKLASDPSESARLLGLASLTNPVFPLGAKLFTTASGNDSALRFMLSDPRLYRGASPLGRIAEQSARRSGIGLGTGLHANEEPRE